MTTPTMVAASTELATEPELSPCPEDFGSFDDVIAPTRMVKV